MARAVAIAMSWAKLEQIAHHLGTAGGVPRYWAPDPEHANVEFVLGVPPPPGHIWWRDGTQLKLGMERCQDLGVPAFTLRRKLKPPGAKPKVSHPHHCTHLLIMSHL